MMDNLSFNMQLDNYVELCCVKLKKLGLIVSPYIQHFLCK